jgi:hypothetical protein
MRIPGRKPGACRSHTVVPVFPQGTHSSSPPFQSSKGYWRHCFASAVDDWSCSTPYFPHEDPMVVLLGWAVSYERGTPVARPLTPQPSRPPYRGTSPIRKRPPPRTPLGPFEKDYGRRGRFPISEVPLYRHPNSGARLQAPQFWRQAEFRRVPRQAIHIHIYIFIYI